MEGDVWVRKPNHAFYEALPGVKLSVHGRMVRPELEDKIQKWAEVADMPNGTELLVCVLMQGGLARYKVTRTGVKVERV